MNWNQSVTALLDQLVDFAIDHGMMEEEDRPYYRNLLMDCFGLDAPETYERAGETEIPPTATALLKELSDLAAEKGLIEDAAYARDLFSTRLMGLVTPAPQLVRERFARLAREQSSREALDDFYHLCRVSDYIKVDAIAQNIRYMAETDVGELEITINLSKPEKDPKEIARLRSAPSVGYPRCMLCIENPGYAGRSNFPARQNHRILPLNLDGDAWYLQYSPYAYYPEHCIVLNRQHIPMKIDEGTFNRLFAFVRQFPHYFLGSNADLPIVGGSILNHDHFQGGNHVFPMDHAPTWKELEVPEEGIRASLLRWPLTCICLESEDEEKLKRHAMKVLEAWREWSDPACGIYARTENTPHNTITPILRLEDGIWKLRLVLRNNRTSDEHPLGIFHPHAELHHIKKENIGLIEVMGLFILPGRLKGELAALEGYLTGEKEVRELAGDEVLAKHEVWMKQILARRGLCADAGHAREVLRQEVAKVCAQVLRDAGVYKLDEKGLEGALRFTAHLGWKEA